MKTKILTLAALLIFTGCLLTSCGKTQDKTENEKIEKGKEEVKDAKEDLQKTETQYAIEVMDFKKVAEEKMLENKKTIEELKAKRSTKKTAKEKEKYDVKIAELEIRNDNLRIKLRDYKEEKRTEKWESFKREFNHDMDELGSSIKDIFRDNEK